MLVVSSPPMHFLPSNNTRRSHDRRHVRSSRPEAVAFNTSNESSLKPVVVGEELLGKNRRENGNPAADYYFEPLVTDPVPNGQRFVLLPHRRFIIVLSHNTGKRLGILALENGNSQTLKVVGRTNDGASVSVIDTTVSMECAVLAESSKNPQEMALSKRLQLEKKESGVNSREAFSQYRGPLQSLFVGCSHGCILEYPITDLESLGASASTGFDSLHNLGEYSIPGPVGYPKRCFRLSGGESYPVRFLTFPKYNDQTTQNHGNSVLCYALVMTGVEQAQTRKRLVTWSDVSLIRLFLPYRDLSSDDDNFQNIELSNESSWNLARQVSVTPTTIARKRPIPNQSSQLIQLLCICVNDGVMLMIASHKDIRLLFDAVQGDDFPVSISYKLSSGDPLTAIAASSRGFDIACGHQSGKIFVLKKFVDLYHEYLVKLRQFGKHKQDKTNSLLVTKPCEPDIIRRRLHWHAHAVASLCFESNSVATEPYLYSGGIESVLCGWQLARGVDKPSFTLPRIAISGISHICHVGDDGNGQSSGVLVYCSNGTLQLFNAHNLKIKWKALSAPQPLMLPNRNEPSLQLKAVRDQGSTKTDTFSVAFFGSRVAGGYIHLYDPRLNSIDRSLEIAPYNRVSRAESKDMELPIPLISHAAWSDSGEIMMTVDVVTTEAFSFGVESTMPDGTRFGSVTNLKFWSATKSGNGELVYQVVAQLSSPHGKSCTVCAAALSATGNFACTVSAEERAFRVWARRESTSSAVAPWLCKYRVEFPCGFSNMYEEGRAMSMSSDGSTLAIGFAHYVTVWDLEEQLLLASFSHRAGVDLNAAVNRIVFLPSTSRSHGVMLISSEHYVALKQYARHNSRSSDDTRWHWPQTGFLKSSIISCCEYISSANVVAVALYNHRENEGKIVFLKMADGATDTRFDWVRVPGRVSAMTSLREDSKQKVPGRNESTTATERIIDIMFVVNRGLAYRWFSSVPNDAAGRERQEDTSTRRSIPSLDDHITNPRKRSREAMTSLDLACTSEKKLSLDHFGRVRGSTMVDDELPLLRGAFSRAFLSRQLCK
ncbi:hypothetical protein ACA910_016056 [Epithemia clementina (nom. ined.)]